MAKLILDTIAKYDEVNKINSNFDKIEAEFQNKALYRNNPTGEPNTVESDIDFNQKRIFNAASVSAAQFLENGVSITQSAANAAAAAVINSSSLASLHAANAAASAASAAASAVNSDNSATASAASAVLAGSEADDSAASAVASAASAVDSSGFATASASSATSSDNARIASEAARDKSEQWSEGVGEVEPGQFSAKHWATEASQIIIDDSTTSLTKAWSSSKVSGKVDWSFTTTAIDKTLVAREFCSVTAATKSITLPATPVAQTEVVITVGSFSDTLVLRNGATIRGVADDVTINVPDVTMHFVYDGTTWRIY